MLALALRIIDITGEIIGTGAERVGIDGRKIVKS
jgi:hypothetical protein